MRKRKAEFEDITAEIVREQPGYQKGTPLRVMRSQTGGYRLYVLVSGRWMDGSLDDITVPAGQPAKGR